MAGRVRGRPGGIWGLLDVLDDHGEAVEYDLVVAGWTLDDVPHRLSWRALSAFVRQSTIAAGTALHRTLAGDDHVWGLNEQLLAAVFDVLQIANWQRASAGKSRPKKPKPLPRPGVGPRKVGGRTSMPLSRARDLFRHHNPQAFAWQPSCTGDDCSRTDIHARGLCGMHYQRWRRAQ